MVVVIDSQENNNTMHRYLIIMSLLMSAMASHASPDSTPAAPVTDELNMTSHHLDVGMPEIALDYSDIVNQVYLLQINAWIVAVGVMVLLLLGLKLVKKTTLDPSILSTLVFVSMGLALTLLRLKLS
jgi:hypothetical protein